MRERPILKMGPKERQKSHLIPQPAYPPGAVPSAINRSVEGDHFRNMKQQSAITIELEKSLDYRPPAASSRLASLESAMS
jgi:hypothetical protein